MSRFVVFGAGGIGGVIGAQLHRHGHEVALIARGPHLDAIRTNGLRFQNADDDVLLEVPAFGHPSEVPWQEDDIVLMAMKSQDAPPALAALASYAPASVAVVCAQNGVANEPAALRFFGRVYGICVMCPTNHLEPGVVQAYSTPVTGILDIGRFPTGVDETARRIASALAGSTFVSEPRHDIMRWKYGKLLMNLGNAVSALCGPEARAGDLYRLLREEAIEVLHAAGIDFVDRDEDRARRGEIMTIRPVSGELRLGGSTWQSLERGLSTVETDYLNGEIVMLGRLHGIATPANELMQRMMIEAARDGNGSGQRSPAELLAELAHV